MSYSISVLRHSIQHVMVFAIRNLFGFDKWLGVGPVISDGCYQDLDFHILPEHFPLLEEEMRRIIAKDIVISSQLVSIDEALALFPADAQPYKNELLRDIQQHGTTRADRDANEESCELLESMGEGLVRLYSFGEHLDLCRGPHVSRTGDLSDIAFKLDRVAGAYWRGSEKNPMLCRLYALVFATADEMADHLHRREEAKRRDHRKVGEQQELFFFHPSAAGMAYWLPKGVILKNTLIEFWRQYHQERGYQEIQTPLLNKRELWDISCQATIKIPFQRQLRFPPLDQKDQAVVAESQKQRVWGWVCLWKWRHEGVWGRLITC